MIAGKKISTPSHGEKYLMQIKVVLQLAVDLVDLGHVPLIDPAPPTLQAETDQPIRFGYG